jgi:hypothetical protein
MPSNNFPFARFPVEGAPHGSNVTIGPNPFDKPKGRRNDPPPTSPESANRYAWWDANSIGTLFQDTAGTVPVAANNDPVGDWHDVDGNLIQWEQATAGDRPIYKTNVLNGKPGIKFDGTSDHMVLTTVLNQARMDESTVFAVVSGWVTGTYQGLVGPANGTAGQGQDAYYLRITDVDKAEVLEAYVGNPMTSTAAISTAGAVIGFKFSDTGNAYTHYNGRNDNGTGASTVTFSGSASILGAQLGVTTEFFTGYIHELLIYDVVLNDTKIDNNARYLLNKWGL